MEESDEEELPTFASMLQTSGLGRRRSLCPASKARGDVVVVSSGSEDEEEAREEEEDGVQMEVAEVELEDNDDEVIEVVPLAERIKRRVEGQSEAAFESPGPCAGDASGRDRLCAGADPLAPGGSRPCEVLVPSGDVPCGHQGGTCGAERPSLCPLPASLADSADQPGRALASPETSSAPKRPKYGQKDRAASSRAAEQRRKEREERRRQQEEEKEKKRALARRLRAQRPGECQKYIRVVLDPVLLQIEGGGQVLSALQAANYSCVVEDQAVPCSITWRRKSVSAQVEEEEWTEEPNVLVLLRLEEFLSMVRNYKQEAQGRTDGQGETLQSYVAHAMEKMPGKILALAVAEVENYFRSQSKKTSRQAAVSGKQGEEQGKGGKRKSKGSGMEITRMDVEEATVDLYLDKQVQVSIFESWEELGEFTMMFTKAVAEAPYKREQENTGFSFCLEKSWCGGVKVDRFGNGLFEVWKRQIQQFNRVSVEMAEAVVSVYPSPLLLIEAYNKCSSEQERVNMLANIPVHRGDGVTATCRRIGPELSRRIYLQMTSLDPDLCLDVTG